VRAILLHLASRDVDKRGIAEERQEMDADVLGLRAYISRVAFAQRDNLELADKRRSGIFETGTRWCLPPTTIKRRAGSGDWRLDRAVQQSQTTASALAILDAALHVPVARKILGCSKASFLGSLSMVAAA
jgi:hypothetical protein